MKKKVNISCRKRENWIDILRGIAIIAVVLDHSFAFFPPFRYWLLSNHTYFSVNWFIFLAAYSNSISFSQHPGPIWKRIFSFYKRRMNIIYSYLLATLIYFIISSYPQFKLDKLISNIFSFNAGNHLYFIQVILQLYLIFPFIYLLFKKAEKLFIQLLILGIIGYVFMKIIFVYQQPWYYQNFLAPLGAGYMLAFSIGIFYFLQPAKIRKLILFLCLPVFIILEIYLIKTWGIFTITIPNLKLFLWSISLLIIMRWIFVKWSERGLFFLKPVIYLGQKSIFIYLFHFIILELLSKTTYAANGIFFIFSITLSIIISLLIERLYSEFKYYISILVNR